VHTIQQKWVEGSDLEDTGKFLQSWAPEPYRNKPMPKGMLQASKDKACKARRRAGERKELRNKIQNTLLKRISLLKAALTETTPQQPRDEIKGATRKAMQGLEFLHLRPTFQKHDR